jgi:hypothetical protein
MWKGRPSVGDLGQVTRCMLSAPVSNDAAINVAFLKGDSSEKDVISKLFLLDLVVVHVLQKKVYLDRPS